MNNFDSLKLQFSTDLIQFDSENYNKTTKEIEDCETTFFDLRYCKKKTGIKNVRISSDKSCTIEISSKLIPDLYYNMINVATITEYLKEINKPELIQFNTDSLIYNSQVLTCDVTNNLKVSDSVSSYIDSMLSYKLNDKYTTKYYPNESIIFERNVKTASLKQHITIYNKYPELLSKRNLSFKNSIEIENFKNVLRFESKFLNFELMRNSFKVNDLNLISLLNSKEKINYNIINSITDIKNINIQTFNNYNSLIKMKNKIKHSKLRNLQGNLSILHTCNYDMDLIRLYFKTNSTANNSRYIKEMKQLLKFKSDIDNKEYEDKITEMKQLLLAS